ncbi:MAG TPA: hypothetical protein VGK93_12885 [Candidatus Eisenbacteria bacterium]
MPTLDPPARDTSGSKVRDGWASLAARSIIPSLGNYCLLLVLVLLVGNSSRFLTDSDTGWHIRTGDWIVDHGRVPHRDVFSYTMAGHEWFAWEWLTDVAMSAIHRVRGLVGIVAASILLLALSYGALFHVMRWRGADAITSFVLTLVAAYTSMIHWLARPHLVSMALMIVWCAIVETYRRTRTRWIYAVPVLIALWANFHGAFVVTFAMLGIYAAGDWLELASRGQGRSLATSRAMSTYGVVGGLSAVGALLTPYGFQLYGHLWEFLTDRALLGGIQDFQSPNFHHADGMMIEWLVFLGVVAAVRAARHRRFVESGLVLFWSHLTLQSERHVALAVIVLVPFIAAELSQGVASVVARAGSWHDPWGSRSVAVRSWYQGMMRVDGQLNGLAGYAGLLGFALIAAAGGLGDRWLQGQFDPRRFPVAAVDAMVAENRSTMLGTHLFAHDQYGGYLIYRLYPDIKVFVDGRNDLFARGKVLDDMVAVAGAEPSWAGVLDRYDVGLLLLPVGSPIGQIAQLSNQWKLEYQDRTAQVLSRTARKGRGKAWTDSKIASGGG